jgi:hypothetical protein
MRILSGIQPSGVLHAFVIPSEVEESLTFFDCTIADDKVRSFDFAQDDS